MISSKIVEYKMNNENIEMIGVIVELEYLLFYLLCCCATEISKMKTESLFFSLHIFGNLLDLVGLGVGSINGQRGCPVSLLLITVCTIFMCYQSIKSNQLSDDIFKSNNNFHCYNYYFDDYADNNNE